LDPFSQTQFLLTLFELPSSDTQNSLLLEQLKTFLELPGEIAFPSWSFGDNFETLAVGSHSEGINDDMIIDDQLCSLLYAMCRPGIFTVSQSQYPKQTVGVFW